LEALKIDLIKCKPANVEYSVCSSPEIILIQSTCASPEIISDASVVENVQILEKFGIKDEILPKLKDWMKKVVLPHYTSLVGGNKRADRDNSSVSINAQQINETIKIIINKAIENPKKV
jgi:hypothetical protein